MEDDLFEEIRNVVMAKHDWVISDSTEYHGATRHREVVSARMGDLGGAVGPVQRGNALA